MKSKFALLSLFLLMLCLNLSADESYQWLAPLDKVLENRSGYTKQKNLRLDKLRGRINTADDDALKLTLIERMYKEYYTFRFDSAMSYANREYEMAVRTGNKYYKSLAEIHRALLLAINGCYSEAEDVFLKIDTASFDRVLKFEYAFTGMSIYSYWSGYSNGNQFAHIYDSKRDYYLAKSVEYGDRSSALWYYLKAELIYYVYDDLAQAAKYYKMSVDRASLDTRAYACATYGLARCQKEMGHPKGYEKWIVQAAISDQVCPLKENLALQEIAMYIFEKDKKNAAKAAQYIYCSLADARFYNNKLRILEISGKLPGIMSVYKSQLDHSRHVRTIQSCVLGVLALLLFVALFFIWKQNGRLSKWGRKVHAQNTQLTQLNGRLRETDERREKYMRLFMDLCAIYIGKLNNYQKLVIRKIKAHQEKELVNKVNYTKLTEQEATDFNIRFDKAFLELFPNFIEEFNGLLRDGEKIAIPDKGGLSTELRIYALVRLGVKESTEIATLLFYSVQTIYNYRNTIKNKAINRDTFEQDVTKLCTVID